MKTNTVLTVVAVPLLLLGACSPNEGEDGSDGASEDAAEETETASSDDTEAKEGEASGGEEASTEQTDTAAAAEADAEAPKVDKTWRCEDQGDTEITFVQGADGTSKLIHKSASEMAANEPAIVTELEATGASAGDPERFGRMRDEQGFATVWFLKDGRVEVTEGEGDGTITYYCNAQ